MKFVARMPFELFVMGVAKLELNGLSRRLVLTFEHACDRVSHGQIKRVKPYDSGKMPRPILVFFNTENQLFPVSFPALN